MNSSNLPPGVNEGMIPGNRPWDIEMEKLYDDLDGSIVKALTSSDHLSPSDVPDLLRDLLHDYENLPQNYMEAYKAVEKRAKRVIYECPECGGKDVEITAWIHMNKGRVQQHKEGPLEFAFCPDCGKFTGAKESNESGS